VRDAERGGEERKMTSGTSDLTHRLAKHPFLEGLSSAFVKSLEPGTEGRTYGTGEVLIREGTPAKELLLVEHGKVALEMQASDRPRLTLLTVGPGEIVGWSVLIPPHNWNVDGRALKTTEVLAIEGRHLRKAMEADPAQAEKFLLRLLHVLDRRLEIARTQVMDIHGR
jgi:CRP/FNR family transcriptional regulator, cyclic AMP receptor protein